MNDIFSNPRLLTPVKMLRANLWSVPVIRNESTEAYSVHVGDKMVRMFDVKTLPDALKERLAMINAIASDKDWNSSTWEICRPPHYPEIYETVGWMVGRSNTNNVYYYVVILPFEDLSYIRGETV